MYAFQKPRHTQRVARHTREPPSGSNAHAVNGAAYAHSPKRRDERVTFTSCGLSARFGDSGGFANDTVNHKKPGRYGFPSNT